MKPLAMLAIAMTVSGSTTTVIDIPDGMVIAVFRQTCLDSVAGADVDCGTPTVVVPALSTGPFTLKSTSGDCYRIDYMNPNGTMNKSPATYVPCPKP